MRVMSLYGCQLLALLLASQLLVGCTTTVRGKLNKPVCVIVRPWLRELSSVDVTMRKAEFFRSSGMLMVDTPVLSRDFAGEFRAELVASLRASGCTVDSDGAPALAVDLDEVSLQWSGEFGIGARSRLVLTAKSRQADRWLGVTVVGEDSDSGSGVMLASRAQEQLSRAIERVIRNLLSTVPIPLPDAATERSRSGRSF